MRASRFCLLALALAAGCGPRGNLPATVSGKVSYNGQPLPGGTIVFHSKDMGSYAGTVGEGGAYEITGVPAGDLVVTVETETLNPKNKPPVYAGGRGAANDKKYDEAMRKMGRPDPPDMGKKYVKIPPRYAKEDSSKLTVTLKSGKQNKDIELTD
jgi:hypothetical protein